MARAFRHQDNQDPLPEPPQGEWQALRGELVALLDQVEGRYGRAETLEPAYGGLTQRVRNLREQVSGHEPNTRHREALRTVKRAVDRFSERDDVASASEDALQSAIAEIRSRQFSAPAAALGRRVTDAPEFRELTTLVGSLSGRLGQLEGELKSHHSDNGNIGEVASQVEQLTHVVELLAGAVGETGQVKRLEAQIGALARLVGETPKVDLSAVNARLDDVSATVGKLAELQAQQMEREIERQDRDVLRDDSTQEAMIAPMQAIEKGVRNVYDRIDAIERNVAMSSGDFERLTGEMAAFTQAMRERGDDPSHLIERIEALSAQIGGFEAANEDVAGLKHDISALRNAVMAGMEPRFSRIESQIEALSVKIDEPRASAPASTTQIENQLKLLMTRMDETGAQLDSLAKLYAGGESVAPDYEALATMVAEKTSRAVANTVPAEVSETSMAAMEKRVAALLNTAGKDTAEKLARLEAALGRRDDRQRVRDEIQAGTSRLTSPRGEDHGKLDDMLAALSAPGKSDSMPVNPNDDRPLTDSGFKNAPVRAALDVKNTPHKHPGLDTDAEMAPAAAPLFDPAKVERPPRPQSSFASGDKDPFAPLPVEEAPAPSIEPVVSQSSTSTFVAAARRAQRAKQEAQTAAPASNSLIGKALSRALPGRNAEPTAVVQSEAKSEKISKPGKAEKPVPEIDLAEDDERPSFLVRHRRPLLLAATLVAVSMLALNLVMQRMNSAREAVPSAQNTQISVPETPADEPTRTSLLEAADPDEAATLVKPAARVIDMLDSTTVGAIGGAPAEGFAKPEGVPALPPTIEPEASMDVIAPLDAPKAVEAAEVETAIAEPFELPPDAVGPTELREAAANGSAQAQFEIGAIYTEGSAIEQDYEAAATWYERSAAQGFVPAQYRLGSLYEAGNGVEKDLELAKLWYQRSAEAGNRMAMHNLAALYASGQMGEQQFEAAAEWFERAAEHGMTDSQFNLGMLYARGLGVTQDLEASYKWFSLAARNSDADASKARDDIARSLNAEAVKRLDGEVAIWKAEPIDLAVNFAPIGTWSDDFDPGKTIDAREVIAKVQNALSRLGYDIGSPDGVAGPKTADAIKAFERDTGMTQIGQINPRLLAVLGSQPV